MDFSPTKRRVLLGEDKVNIIRAMEYGFKLSAIAKHMHMSEDTIRSIWDNHANLMCVYKQEEEGARLKRLRQSERSDGDEPLNLCQKEVQDLSLENRTITGQEEENSVAADISDGYCTGGAATESTSGSVSSTIGANEHDLNDKGIVQAGTVGEQAQKSLRRSSSSDSNDCLLIKIPKPELHTCVHAIRTISEYYDSVPVEDEILKNVKMILADLENRHWDEIKSAIGRLRDGQEEIPGIDSQDDY